MVPYTFMSCTQYTPLLGRLVQSVAKTSLMFLHYSALSDLILPNDGSMLAFIYMADHI